MSNSTRILTSKDIKTGKHISPVQRLRIMSADDWEEFIEEWIDSLKKEYSKVERLGGAGDKGRDIVAQLGDVEIWDNYQCKHYDHPLRPSDIWTEIGKLVYYTSMNDFTCPRKYFFIAPLGVGTSLSDFLKDPTKLAQGLRENWDKHCKDKITKKCIIELNDIEPHIKKTDFSIFGYITPLTIIEQHKKTTHFLPRFGGGLPERETPLTPPMKSTSEESEYLRKILQAYSDFNKQNISTIDDVTDDYLKEHYNDSRIQFYSAESLKRFSRDALPEDEFHLLQQEFLNGIKDEIRNPLHANGYIRLLEVVKVARTLQITSHTLIDCLMINDRGGICHQLANDDKSIVWVRNG